MAVYVRNMASESSSSSEDEALKRCQEAVWDCQATKTKGTGDKKTPSKRLVVAEHKHDGNELQVTQGFQTHVAKKLGSMLDSLISEEQSSIQPSGNTETTDDKNDEDEGFLLFSSSVPGQEPEEPPPPKRPRIPSSSGSDSEMEARIREAAISISDILPPSTVLPSFFAAPEASNSETKETVKKKKKKKKKKKVVPEANGQQDSKLIKDNQSTNVSQEENQTVKPKKKKKKKKKKATPGSTEVLS